MRTTQNMICSTFVILLLPMLFFISTSTSLPLKDEIPVRESTSSTKYTIASTGPIVYRTTGIKPKSAPTFAPSICPSFQVVSNPSVDSISRFVGKIVTASSRPTTKPAKTTSSPSFKYRPSAMPSQRPSFRPSRKPTTAPSANPSMRPTCIPTTAVPTTNIPTKKPSRSPSFKTSSTPSKSALPTKSAPATSLMKTSPPTPTRIPTKAPTSAPFADIKYLNRSLLTTQPLVLYNIYYGDFQSTVPLRKTRQLMDYFSTYLGKTDWYKALYSYYQIVNGVKTYISQPAVFGRSTTYLPTARAIEVTEYQLQQSIIDSINLNRIPYDPNALYTVMFRGDFKTSGWLTNWCGYHAYFNLAPGQPVAYAVIGDPSTSPDQSLQSNCEGWNPPTANGNLGADSMISVYAHEVAEALTGTYSAWQMDNGDENGDACSWNFGPIPVQSNMKIGNLSALVQQLWKPGFGCTMSVNVPTMAPTFWSKHNWAGPPTFSPAVLPTVSPSFPADVSYHGGPVMTGQVTLYNIYVGDFSSASGQDTKSLVDFFAANIGTSPWYKVLTNYYQLNGNKKTFVSDFAHFNSSYSLFPTASAMNITDDDLKQAIDDAMAASQIPIDENGVYTLIMRGDFSLLYKGFRWASDFCSYHSAFYTPDQRLIKYVVVGDPSTSRPPAINCIPISDGPTVNGNLGGDSIVTEYAKNLADTVTGFSGAWYSDYTQFGSGFSCAGEYGNRNVNWNMKLGGKAFLIQQVWQPSIGCVSVAVPATTAPSIAATRAPTIPSNLDIAYHGGLVMTGPIKLYNIYLGDFDSTAALRNETALIDYFTSHIGGSDWFNVLTAYYQMGANNVKTYVSNSAQLVMSIVVPLAAGVTSMAEADIQSKLKVLISSGKLPVDVNGVYNIIFRGELSVNSPGLGAWGPDWCSIHGTTTISTSSGTQVVLKYTLSGDPSRTTAAQRCLPPSSFRPTPNQQLGADSIVSELANSLAGAVTNSDINNNGWYFADYSDAGDACFGNYGASSGFHLGNANIQLGSKWFLIQQNWLPKYGCRMTK
mmetsp:Transcript_19092/g.27315  ORF Transcript_19092/g.27315 Transcript_19092/m.27315 type:complete len:1041 (+) Transcript_19092:35-3157(+)